MSYSSRNSDMTWNIFLTSSFICIALQTLYQYPFLVSYVCILDSTWIVTWDKAIMSWWWNLWTTEGHILRWCPLSTPCPWLLPQTTTFTTLLILKTNCSLGLLSAHVFRDYKLFRVTLTFNQDAAMCFAPVSLSRV